MITVKADLILFGVQDVDLVSRSTKEPPFSINVGGFLSLPGAVYNFRSITLLPAIWEFLAFIRVLVWLWSPGYDGADWSQVEGVDGVGDVDNVGCVFVDADCMLVDVGCVCIDVIRELDNVCFVLIYVCFVFINSSVC